MSRWSSLSRSLIGSPEAGEILSCNGLTSLDEIFRVASHATSRHQRRGVCSVELKETSGSTFTAYFKLNWGRPRLWPRMSDIKTGQVLQSLVLREWKGLELVEQHGFKSPERLGLFEDGLLQRRSAIIIRAVPPPLSLSEMIRDVEWTHRSEDEREALLAEARAVLDRIDAAGLAWRGSSTRHMFPEKQADGSWAMWLIDCEGVHPRSANTKDRDLARFERTLKTDHVKRSQKHTADPHQAVIHRAAA